MKLILPMLILTTLLLGCDTTSRDQAYATREITAEADRQVGMPAIKNFTQRRDMKRILELCDDPTLLTYTYIVSMDGKLVFLTKSIGYGLPYATQYTNPVSILTELPQAEPNGLYLPDASDATWILAVNADGSTTPMYVEPTIIVSPTQLH